MSVYHVRRSLFLKGICVSRLCAALLSVLGGGVRCAAVSGDGPTSVDVALMTVAERSEYRATARHAEVVELLDRLADASPVVRRMEMGTTMEGRSIPMVVIADPPVETAAEARAAERRTTNGSRAANNAGSGGEDGRIVVLAIGNIHAGEVDGKEALPMVARELALTAKHPLLRDLIVVIAPIYNADGNEQVSKDNRPGQVGPEEGMGRRENAGGLDLNRDFIKLEAPETRALVRTLNEWDPSVFIDTHTTNGCFHRYVITYEGPKTPTGDAGLIEYVRERMMPEVEREAERKYGVPSFVYGDFDATHRRWESYPAFARYGTSYVGLRGRISILSEGYSYAPYRTRVEGTRDFVKACLEYAASNKREIRALLAAADGAARAGETRLGEAVAVRFEAERAPEKVVARGFVEEKNGEGAVNTGVPKEYEVELWTRYRATRSVPRPAAYLVPAGLANVVENLRLHGVETRRMGKEREVDAEVYRITSVKFAERAFQNHRIATVEVDRRTERRKVEADCWVVPTGQKLGSLAMYLLEPECEDGLAAWNFMDAWLRVGEDFPIMRLATIE